MTIDEAIIHCEEVANDRAGCCEDCAEEHRQLAEWLKDYKRLLEQEPIFDKIRAELHATAEIHENGDYYLREEWIDEIFDKYKGRK